MNEGLSFPVNISNFLWLDISSLESSVEPEADENIWEVITLVNFIILLPNHSTFQNINPIGGQAILPSAECSQIVH